MAETVWDRLDRQLLSALHDERDAIDALLAAMEKLRGVPDDSSPAGMMAKYVFRATFFSYKRAVEATRASIAACGDATA